MTIGEAIIEVYEHTGEPSNLDPFLSTSSPPYSTSDLDTSSYGYLKLADYIERGIRRVITYKSGRSRFRFDETKKRILWSLTITEYDDVQVGADYIQFNTGLTAAQAATYVGKQYILTGENDGATTTDLVDKFFTIVDYTWSDANAYGVNFETDIDLTDYVTESYAEIRTAEREYELPSDVLEVLKLTSFSDGNELDYLSRQETAFYETNPTVVIPTQFYEYNNTVVFNSVPPVVSRFWLEYAAFVTVDTTSISTNLPFREMFDQAIIQWANYWVHDLMHEPERALFAKSDFDKIMKSIQESHEFRYDRTDSGRGSVRFN